MMNCKTLEVAGFMPALQGMRNPMNSWDKSDSFVMDNGRFVIGNNDAGLCQRLIKGGTEHRKFLRQIQVWAEIDMPRYIWQEFDTYKIGTVSNSCSTMHRLHEKEFEISDFYIAEDLKVNYCMITIIDDLNRFRRDYLETKDYECIIRMKRILPESYIQKRVWSGNYEVLRNIYHQRINHRLKDEWGCICRWIESLPYANELIVN